ncbi:hypothetical protein SFRURICE_002031 [Spodoptera frugiperda]|nr:hypothetical protein SFRURICE_002031 [Spodoptera frugiperda]
MKSVLEEQFTKKSIKLCAVYLPPPVSTDTFEYFIESCNSVIDGNSDSLTLLMGDFNLSSLDWTYDSNSESCLASTSSSGYLTNLLTAFLALNNLKQYNWVKNHQSKILDLVLSDIEKIKVDNCISPIRDLDRFHPAIEVALTLTKGLKNNQKVISKPNYYKADYEAINRDLELIDWHDEFSLCSNVNDRLDKFYNIIDNIIKQHVPYTESKRGKYPPWYSLQLKKLLKQKQKFQQRIKAHNNPLDRVEFNYLRKDCKILTRLCYRNYITEIETKIKGHPKFFWTHIKNLRKTSSSYPSEMYLGDECAYGSKAISDLFAKQFCSVYDPSINLVRDTPFKSIPVLPIGNILDINSLLQWCTDNKMYLNSDKCYHIKFTKKRNRIQSSYSINGNMLSEISVIRDLGICLDSRLSYIEHVDKIVNSAYRALGFVLRSSKDFKNPSTTLLLYNSYVRSQLEYCSTVWSPSYQIHITRIEKIQRKVVRHLARRFKFVPVELTWTE